MGPSALFVIVKTDGSFAALLTSTEQASGSVVMGTIIQVEGWKLYVKFIFLILSYLIRWNIMLCYDQTNPPSYATYSTLNKYTQQLNSPICN